MYDYVSFTTTPPLAELRLIATQFTGSAVALLEQVEYIGNQAGCESASWSLATEYDYRNGQSSLRVLSAIISGRRPAVARQAAQQWAVALGLTASPRAMRGTVSYEGEFDGLRIKVWAVVDDAAFGTKYSTLKLYAPDFVLAALLALSLTATGVLAARHGKLAKLAKALIK